MKQPIFFILFLAMLFSATSCFTTRGYHLNNKDEWAKSPDVDSIAFQILLQAVNVWDEPNLYQAAGFVKSKSMAGEFLIAAENGTVVQIGMLADGTAEVVLIYSKWQGNWNFSYDDGWGMDTKNYSGRFVPSIDDTCDKILDDLFTASAKRDLAWLTEFLGEDSIGVQDASVVYGDFITADTTIIKDSVIWNIRYTNDPGFDWVWEFETKITPTSSSVYYFNQSGECLRGNQIIYSMEFVEMKDVTPLSRITMKIARFSGSIYELDCLNSPPIPFAETGLKQD